MTARRKPAGRINGKRKLAGATLAIATATLLLATEIPAGLTAGGGSAALAELAARSPGTRIGGVALKAKAPRSALAPLASEATPGADAPATAVASVLGTSVGPEGAVPNSGPLGAGGFPSDFLAPGVPGALGAPGAPGVANGSTGSGPTPPPGFGGGVPSFGGGGAPIFVPGGPGGTVPGTPDNGETPGGGTLTPPVILPPSGAGAVPEPSTWLLLIAGFGAIGSAMRRNRRVKLA